MAFPSKLVDEALRLQYRSAVPSGERTLHVSAAQGSDSNRGDTPARSLATLQAAIAAAQPGTRILVAADGDYDPTSIYGVRGAPGRWVSVEAAPGGERPRILAGADGESNAINVQQSDRIGLFGLEVCGVPGSGGLDASGIAIFRGSTRVRVWGCEVHHLPGGCVNCFWVDANRHHGVWLPEGGWHLVDIRCNTLHDSCMRSPYNTSAISFYGGDDRDGALLGGYGYQAIGNYIYNCHCQAPCTPLGYDFVTDGNGISIDSLLVANALHPHRRPYVKPGLVEANVVVACGGRGLSVFNSVNVDDVCNTYAGNLQSPSVAFDEAAEAEVTGLVCTLPTVGVRHAGNVVLPGEQRRAFDTFATCHDNVVLGGRQAPGPADQDRRGRTPAFLPAFDDSAANQGLSLDAFLPGEVVTMSVEVRVSGWEALGLHLAAEPAGRRAGPGAVRTPLGLRADPAQRDGETGDDAS